MRKSWGLLKKIKNGNKKIESRWYKNKYPPWGRIREGDIIYFKDSGEPITLKTKVDQVKFYSDLMPEKIEQILLEYGSDEGIGLDSVDDFFLSIKDKKYCILMFLSDVENIEPFEIDKTGFGAMSAWITLRDINNIRKDTEEPSKTQKQIVEY